MTQRYDVNINFIAFVNVPLYSAEFIKDVSKVIDIPFKDIQCELLLDNSVAVSTTTKSVLIHPGDVLLYYPDDKRISSMKWEDFNEYHQNLLNNYEV